MRATRRDEALSARAFRHSRPANGVKSGPACSTNNMHVFYMVIIIDLLNIAQSDGLEFMCFFLDKHIRFIVIIYLIPI